ncbi:uncharacterized protein LOC130303807 [Hyla sarda]|uniref:uncharacterized protein LOC130303807 n=1 Tax=Hyla sarda TaxID=327740 RepID=UPI0024C3D94E|nr:uncharacterized protein LOC130303807 [Hyla sarda]
MCTSILSDETTYRILERDPTIIFLKELKEILIQARTDCLIDEREYDFLLPNAPRLATFYGLPKVHKGLDPLKCRPIVSGVGNLTQNIGIYLDEVLRPFVLCLPSYLRDTMDLLLKIQDIIMEEDYWLCSIDVEALYSSIPHNFGINAVAHYLRSRSTHHAAHNQFILTLLEFVLNRNFFIFSSRFYHQLRGTAMGSPVAPTYANLLLGWWEEAIVFGEDNSRFHHHIIYWGRYIDDVAVIWSGPKVEFENFVQSLNTNPVGLKFTFEIHKDSLVFLDVLLERSSNGNISTKIHRKPTAGNSLLMWSSHHPFSLRNGIPKGQYLRLKRNCSSEQVFHHEAKELRSRFQHRGYPNRVLKKAYIETKHVDRSTLLFSKPKAGDRDLPTRIIGTFDAAAKEIRQILTNHWPILKTDPVVGSLVEETPRITYRRGKNLGDFLVHSLYTPPRGPGTWLDRKVSGSFKCGSCKACKYMRVSKEFLSPSTNKMYKCYDYANCKTSKVIYLATCPCPLCYVGKTMREVRRRILEHMSDIRHKREKPLSLHMLRHHADTPFNLDFQVIEVLKPDIRGGDLDKRLLQAETRWIYRLKTITPYGLNDQLSFCPFI